MFSSTNTPHLIGPDDGRLLEMNGFGVRYMARSDAVAIVEHPLAPRTLGAPVHTHANEDEYSYVTEGRVTIEIDGELVHAGPGDLVIKPRGIPHAFWNETDEPARVLEVITPGGFAHYFDEIQPLVTAETGPDVAGLAQVAARYELEFDFSSIERIARDHGLNLG